MAIRNVQILGTGQLVELQRKLRAAGHEDIRRNLARAVRRAAEPLQADLQRTVRTLPIRGEGSAAGRRRRTARDNGRAGRDAGLRETIARSIRITIRTTTNPGARVWIDKSRLPPDQRNLPARLDEGRWRHPVYGNRRRWATQYAQPWWDVTVRRHQDDMRRQIAKVIDQVRNRLD